MVSFEGVVGKDRIGATYDILHGSISKRSRVSSLCRNEINVLNPAVSINHLLNKIVMFEKNIQFLRDEPGQL